MVRFPKAWSKRRAVLCSEVRESMKVQALKARVLRHFSLFGAPWSRCVLVNLPVAARRLKAFMRLGPSRGTNRMQVNSI